MGCEKHYVEASRESRVFVEPFPRMSNRDLCGGAASVAAVAAASAAAAVGDGGVRAGWEHPRPLVQARIDRTAADARKRGAAQY